MPFYQATGRDISTMEPKSLQISARSEHEAIDTAAMQGVTEIKLRPYSDREMLALDFQCFLNADPRATKAHTPKRIRANSTEAIHETATLIGPLLMRHPLLTITSCALLAIWIDRTAMMLLGML